MSSAVPTAIRLDVAANVMHVTWGDGRTSAYAGSYLRHICPCAACRGHSPGEKEPPSWKQVEGVRVTNVEAVGTYALRLTLSDGHDSGIYSFDALRAACPSERPDVDDVGRPTGVLPDEA